MKRKRFVTEKITRILKEAALGIKITQNVSQYVFSNTIDTI